MPKMKKWLEKYNEISRLGEGGNADVYLVCDKLEGKEYALGGASQQNVKNREYRPSVTKNLRYEVHH